MTSMAKALFEDGVNLCQENGLRLISLRLRNFKGIRDFTLDAQGQSVSVYGDNATGKTTLFDAFLWMLFDKDSQNRKDFEIKTLGPDGEALHGLEHEVEGVFSLGGRTIVLRKMYAEKWTKQRGSAEKVFTGHETSYWIDGVPKKKQEYEAFIASIVDERVFRLLTDPSYFNEQLHWQERRRLLLEVCGDISDDEVIATDDRLAELRTILGDRSLEDHRKVIAARKAKINKELEMIPVRISEVQRGLPDISDIDRAKVTEELEAAKATRKAKLEELAILENGGAIAEKQMRLREIESRLLEIESQARRKVEDALFEKRSKLQDARLAVSTTEREIERLNSEIANKQAESARLAERLEELRRKWYEVDSEEFQHVDETVCPTCGQLLPEEMITEAREKALAAFNLSKSERLEKITAEGKATRQQKERLDLEIERLKNEAIAAQKRLTEAKIAATRLQAEVEKLQVPRRDTIAQDPEHRKLAAERDALTQEINQLKAGAQADLAGLRAEIATLDEKIASLERVLLKVEQRRTGEARIEELKAQEKQLAAEYEELERENYLTEEFIRTKVRLLEEKINSRFQYARFKLFDVQVNGALAECCETMYRGVPYSNLNGGAKMNIGLDIIRTLSEHYNFRAPIFIDNAEAVTRLIPMESQVIRLVVSEKDKTLRVVKEV